LLQLLEGLLKIRGDVAMTAKPTANLPSAKPVDGAMMAFGDYLEQVRQTLQSPALWSLKTLLPKSVASDANLRGTALQTPGAGVGAVAPGLSMALHLVLAGERTDAHAHSFWHIFIVEDGKGEIGLGEPDSIRSIARGDIVFIPTWCRHWFRADEDLILLAIQNLPQAAEAGSLVRSTGSGALDFVYAD
jgi:quercetin dioxygenase-like cupin family protein